MREPKIKYFKPIYQQHFKDSSNILVISEMRKQHCPLLDFLKMVECNMDNENLSQTHS